MEKGVLDPQEYPKRMKGKQFVITGLTSQVGRSLNGKIGFYVGVQYQPKVRYLMEVKGDKVYKIKPRNLVPKGYTLKTIHYPYEVMTLAEEEQIDNLIREAKQSPHQQKEWKLCFKYVGPQTNYCFSCLQFGTACYDYCAYCGRDYLRLMHVEKQKLMLCFKRCQGCLTRGTDLNLVGYCEECWQNKFRQQYE